MTKERETMKGMLAAVLYFGLLSGLCVAGERPALTETKDKESYSLGYQFGQNLKAQGVDINLDIYSSGIRDGMSGTTPQLSQDEIRDTVTELQKRVTAARQKEMKEMADKNLADAKVFLEENKKKEGVTSLPSGLQYKILAEGSGKTPKATDSVTVHYRGTLTNGTEFDSSHKRGQPATFQVGQVIRGWTEALQLMKEGSKWQLFIPPQLGYGDRGTGPIPPNSTLIFEVELISVK
jgi:FKBP-type peptidyl-prolyl cis-trans isomerase FklB